MQVVSATRKILRASLIVTFVVLAIVGLIDWRARALSSGADKQLTAMDVAGKTLDNAAVQQIIGRLPVLTHHSDRFLIERYSYAGGVPGRTYSVSVGYAESADGQFRYVSHSLNMAAEEFELAQQFGARGNSRLSSEVGGGPNEGAPNPMAQLNEMMGRLLSSRSEESVFQRLGATVDARPDGQILRIDFREVELTDSDLSSLRGQQRLTTLILDNTAVSDAGLEHLAGLRKVGWLQLAGTQITDAGLQHLQGLTELCWLVLSDSPISGAGFQHFKDLRKLCWLYLDGTQVDDAGLARLKVLPSIQALHLDGTHVTDAGLEHLANLPILSSLTLDNTQITSAGLKHLAALPNLATLRLSGTHVTDEGLRHLARLGGLADLDLSGTQVTDDGLPHLYNLRALRKLTVKNTQVTDAGARSLVEISPDVEIGL